MNRWMIAALAAVVVVVVAVGIGCGVWGDGDWGPNHNNEVVSRTVGQDGSETIVVREGRGGFFPFGLLLFPLVVLFWVAIIRAFAFRGPWGRGGPWVQGGPPAIEPPGWFDEWHRRSHQPEVGEQPADADKPNAP